MTRLVLSLMLALMCCAAAPTALLAESSGSDAALGVQGAMAELTVEPGQVVTHTMTITLGGAAAEAMQIDVDARGLGQALDGAVVPLTSGIRYADLYVHMHPTADGTVGVAVAIHVPVLMTIAGSTFSEQASITNLDVTSAPHGSLVAKTVLENTGDHHYRANDEVTVTDAAGTVLGSTTVPLAGSSLLPTMEHAYTASIGASAGADELPPGTYTVRSRIVLADRRVLAERQTFFEVSEHSPSGSGSGSRRADPVPTAALGIVEASATATTGEPAPVQVAAALSSSPAADATPTPLPTGVASLPSESAPAGAVAHSAPAADEAIPIAAAVPPIAPAGVLAPVRSVGLNSPSQPLPAAQSNVQLANPSTPVVVVTPQRGVAEVAGARTAAQPTPSGAPVSPAPAADVPRGGVLVSWEFLAGMVAALLSAAVMVYTFRRPSPAAA